MLSIILLPSLAQAEAPYPLASSFQVGTQLDDYLYASALSASGGLYLCGACGPAMQFDVVPSVQTGWIEKYDANGNRLWRSEYSGHLGTAGYEHDLFQSEAVDAADNVYIGCSARYATGQMNPHWNSGIYFLKYDATGKLLWSTNDQIPIGQSAQTAFVAIDGVSGVYGAASGGNYFVTLERYDANGNWIWGGGEYPNVFEAMTSDRAGNVWLTESAPFFGVVEYDRSGKRLVSRVCSIASSTVNSMAADRFGNVYLCGNTSASLDGNNAGGQDIFLAKLDANGTMLWIRQFGSAGDDYGDSVVVDNAGNILVAAETTGDLAAPNQGGTDAVLIKYDAQGNRLWAYQFGTPGAESNCHLAIDPAGKLYFCGTTTGSLAGPNAGGLDVFVYTFTFVPPNQAPVVSISGQTKVPPQSTADLAGVVSDDGLPAPASLSYAWTQISGPASITFSAPATSSTTLAFSTSGTYTVRLTVNDGELSGQADSTIVVYANSAPIVNVGPDRTVYLPNSAALAGVVSDDGYPTPATLTCAWTQVSGPAPVSFSSTAAANTTATFSSMGTYVLRLTVSDSALATFDEVTIVVLSPYAQGDFNGDGKVDGVDFLAWQSHFGRGLTNATGSQGDANGDGMVDGKDFLIWQQNYH